MKPNDDFELRDEYKREDLGKGVRGKYYQAYQKSHNLVLLELELATAFPNDEAVNNALRFLLSIVETSSHTLHLLNKRFIPISS
jgi:hypothetical protein